MVDSTGSSVEDAVSRLLHSTCTTAEHLLDVLQVKLHVTEPVIALTGSHVVPVIIIF
jgi:hypothetical protein